MSISLITMVVTVIIMIITILTMMTVTMMIVMMLTLLGMREPTQVAPGAAGSGLCRLLGQVIQPHSSQYQNQCPPSEVFKLPRD